MNMTLFDPLQSQESPEVSIQEPKESIVPQIIAISMFFATVFSLIVLFFVNAKPWNTDSILFINDIHLNWSYDVTGKESFGQYGMDSSFTLFESAVAGAKKSNPKPSMIILGGDYNCYSLFPNMSSVVNTTKYVIDTVKKAFPNVPVYSLLGNNEFVPNYGYYKNSTNVYKNLSSVFGIPKDQLADFHKGGYYVQDIKKQNTRYIFMNTVIYHHWYNYTDFDTGIETIPDDPFDQFSWLDKKMKEGTEKGMKNAIIMHVPNAVSYYEFEENVLERFQENFFRVFKNNKYSFILCAHTHVDLMLPLFNNESISDVVSLSSVSISPQHWNNPGFRVYETRKGKLIDYTQYMADLAYANDSLDWFPEYTFSETYKVHDLTAESILKAVKYIKNNKMAFNAFMSFVNAQANAHKYFYDCLLTGTNTSSVKSCMGLLNSVRESNEVLRIIRAFVNLH